MAKDLLKRVSIIQKHQPGEIIVDKTTLNTTMFILMEGMVTVKVHSGQKGTLIAQKASAKGSFFGGLGLTDCYNRYITVKAESPVLLMVIPLKHVEEQRNYDRIDGEKLYQNLLIKAEGFNDEIRRMELDAIKRKHAKGQSKKHSFHYDTPYQNVLLAEEAEKYLLKKTVKCPLCRRSFETDVIRTSRLQLKKRGEYFINEYKEVEPLWLDIIVCPECYYAERLQFFEKDNIKELDQLYRLLLDIKSSSLFSYSARRTAEEVINAYLIYEKCIEKKGADLKEKAKAAILIAELYRRLDSPGLADVYYDKAFQLYDDLISAGVVDVDMMQMQQLYIILGKLYERKGMVEQAILQYKHAKMIFGVLDKRYTNIADSCLISLNDNNR